MIINSYRFGAAVGRVIDKIRIQARATYAYRVNGAKIYGGFDGYNVNGTELHTISGATDNSMTDHTFTNTTAYTYYWVGGQFNGGTTGTGECTELEFWGGGAKQTPTSFSSADYHNASYVPDNAFDGNFSTDYIPNHAVESYKWIGVYYA